MTNLRRTLVILTTVFLSATMALGASAATDAPSEGWFLELINQERVDQGLNELAPYWDIVDDAQAHSERMSSEQRLHHNPQLGNVTNGWYRLGENVGVGPTVPSLHDAFMASPAHRANVLGDYNYVGIGVVVDSPNTMWVTVVFMKGPAGLAGPPPAAPDPDPAASSEPAAATTLAFVNPNSGQWHLRSRDGSVTTFYYGDPGDYPVIGDWDCDGVDTPGLYRQRDGYVYLRNRNTQGNADIRFFFGNPSDVPLAGDWNGDGCDTISVYRPVEGRVYIINELGENERGLGRADYYYDFGRRNVERVLTGDFDGDGIDEVGLFHPDQRRVSLRLSHDPSSPISDFPFGERHDKIVAGDWSGDGEATVAAFRPADRQVHLRHPDTHNAGTRAVTFARSDWYPVAGNFGLDD